MIPFVSAMFRGGAPQGPQPIGGTWDPTYTAASLALGPGNLFVYGLGGGSFGVTLGTSGKTTGSWRFSTFIDLSTPAAPVGVGVGNTSTTLTTYLGATADSICYFGNGTIYTNNTLVTTVATYTTGDTIDVEFDADARTIDFYKNTVLVSSLSISGITGSIRAGATIFYASDALTADFT